MKTSSFFMGMILGAVASSLISRNREMLGLTPGNNGTSAGKMMQKARSKMIDAAFPGMGDLGGSQRNEGTHAQESSTHSQSNQRARSTNDKETSMKMIKDFIRTSPDVKKEVEQILQETHTAVPGL